MVLMKWLPSSPKLREAAYYYVLRRCAIMVPHSWCHCNNVVLSGTTKEQRQRAAPSRPHVTFCKCHVAVVVHMPIVTSPTRNTLLHDPHIRNGACISIFKFAYSTISGRGTYVYIHESPRMMFRCQYRRVLHFKMSHSLWEPSFLCRVSDKQIKKVAWSWQLLLLGIGINGLDDFGFL